LIGFLKKLAAYPRTLRGLAIFATVAVILFLVDNFLIYVLGWPGINAFLIHLGLLVPDKTPKALEDGAVGQGWVQFAAFVAAFVVALIWIRRTEDRSLSDDADLYSGIAAFIVRAAFWAVFLVGITDMLLSFVRVEGFLQAMVSDHLTTQLGRSIFRGTWIHYPLIGVAIVVALFTRSLGFIWLALMIVAAEFLIVITRFVFSYEQAFMGDLVRFWYAALFLFASAYTLLNDGHVRVDVLYAGFTKQGKAVTNSIGSLLLGLPLCWTILILGTSSKGSIIVSPMLSFEISQSGYGMYTKYLMAGYLMIFAFSMAIQFVSLFLSNMALFADSAGDSDNG
jgi:TRAP-type mannitol/chloroaromatic compound transport system permease small subunit